MSEDFNPNRRPAGTPAGGQFAPTHRPEAVGIELDDGGITLPSGGAGGDGTPAGVQIPRVVALHESALDDIVIEIESALGDETRDSDESAYWAPEEWSDHLESLLGQVYGSVSVSFSGDAGAYRIVLSGGQSSRSIHAVDDALRGLGALATPLRRHENPDGTVGGLVADGSIVSNDAWVAPGARVLGRAHVLDRAKVLGRAVVSGRAIVADEAVVRDRAQVLDAAVVAGRAEVSGDAVVQSRAMVLDHARVSDAAIVSGSAMLADEAKIGDHCVVTDNVTVGDLARARDHVYLGGDALVSGRTVLEGARVLAGCEVA